MNLSSHLSPAAPEPQSPGLNQPLGGISEGQKGGAATDADSQLWQAQQAHLAILRQELCALEKLKRNRGTCDTQITSKFSLLTGRIHIDQWQNLLPTFDAISRLGVNYHRVFVVFGGWHHPGNPGNMNPPPDKLLVLLKRYRGLVKAETTCHELAKKGMAGAGDSSSKLKKILEIYKNVMPGNMWNQPDRLLEYIDEMKPATTMEIEHALLFLQPRIFAFAPTSQNPTAGWDDFKRFVYAYRLLVEDFHSEFSTYYWGIYPAKS